MFTGIIKARGSVKKISPQGGDFQITFNSNEIKWNEFTVGESIAINGVCLTAVKITNNGFDADVSGETMRVTAFRDLKEGDAVNLEPSLAIGERIGGHFVSGHVDCVGRIVGRQKDARSIAFEVELPEGYSIGDKVNIEVDLIARYLERLLDKPNDGVITKEFLEINGYD